MEFSVTIISRGSVRPSGPTRSGVLELSAIDTLPALRGNVQTLHVYKHGPGAAKVIRDALSKALVPYYPLAGRLRFFEQSELRVDCSGDGAWFVEASADCTLDEVGYFDDVTSVPCGKLLPDPPREVEGLDPLVQMQVTQFRCDGFVVGLTFCHSVCDGLGAAQFLNAVGEMARGAYQPSITPAWCRDFLPPSPQVNHLPLRPIPNYQLEHATIDLPLEKIKELKQEFQNWTLGEKSCSTFEMVAAVLWRARARAINLPLVKLVFFANCRQLVQDPPLPRGFYGNCFFPVSVTLTKQDMEEDEKGSSEVFRAVKLIQEAKAGLGKEFGKWLTMKKNEQAEEDEEADPFVAPLEYGTLFMSEWGRLGFKEVDYGWGKPVHIVPIQGSSIMPAGIILSPPAPANGIRLMTWCVEQSHLRHLLQNINSLY